MSGLKDKASKINFSALPTAASQQLSTAGLEQGDAHRPKTAPGLMMAHAADLRSEIVRDNERLTAEVTVLGDQVELVKAESARLDERLQDVLHDVEQWSGAKATRLLDTTLVVRSRWANRDMSNFVGDEFDQLVQEIANAGGNVQPIKVRPVSIEGAAKFEIVFGHRRREACHRLGLPVLAMIDALDDQSLFIEMDRENRLRKNLSPWEQGVMYRRALDSGLWPSNRKLADALSVDLTNLGRALSLARLPDEVVAAFVSPMDLQYRWATALAAAVDVRRDVTVTCARKIAAMDPRPPPGEVFKRLVESSGGIGSVPPPTANSAEILNLKSGRLMATVRQHPESGEISISFVEPKAKEIDITLLSDGLSTLLNSLFAAR